MKIPNFILEFGSKQQERKVPALLRNYHCYKYTSYNFSAIFEVETEL